MTTLPTPGAQKIRVGDHVPFRWSVYDVEGIVIEDRGGFGVGGRQIIRIAFAPDPTDADPARRVETERPAEEVQVVTQQNRH